MTPAETILAGSPLRFLTTQSRSDRTIEAEWVEKAARAAQPLYIENAIIRGCLDLKHWNPKEEVSFAGCEFSGSVDLSYTIFTRRLSLPGARFVDGFNCTGMTARLDLDLRNASFAGNATFVDIEVNGIFDATKTKFEKGVTADFLRAKMLNSAKFREAIFGGPARFLFTHFQRQADFISAVFHDKATFNGAHIGEIIRFHIDLDTRKTGAVFHGDVDFRFAYFRQALLMGATFAGVADFLGVRVDMDLALQGVVFEDGVNFNRVQIAGSLVCGIYPEYSLPPTMFKGRVDFVGARIDGQSQFVGVTFCKPVLFNSVVFSKAAFFNEVKFQEAADFENAVFQQGGHFKGALFASSAKFRKVEFQDNGIFTGSVFKQDAIFNRSKFCQDVFFRAEPDDHLRGTLFEGKADFIGAQISGAADFRGAVFKESALFALACFHDTVFFCAGAKRPAAVFEADLDCSGVEFRGSVDFRGVKFRRKVSFNASRFRSFSNFKTEPNNAETIPSTEFAEVVFDNCRITEDGHFENCLFREKASFREASFRTLFFSASGQVGDEDQFQGAVDLRGCEYERIQANWRSLLQFNRVARRYRRFRRQVGCCDGTMPRQTPYDRQVYSRLQKAFRTAGQDGEANEVYLERRRLERKQTHNRLHRFWDWIYAVFAGYGVKPYRLVLSSAVLIVFGTVVFTHPGAIRSRREGNSAQMEVQSDPLTLNEAIWFSVTKFLPLDIGEEPNRIASDSLIPIDIPLGVRDWSVKIVPSSYARILRLLGWILVPLGVAGISGAMLKFSTKDE